MPQGQQQQLYRSTAAAAAKSQQQHQSHAPSSTLPSFVVLHVPSAALRNYQKKKKKPNCSRGKATERNAKKLHKKRVHSSKIQRLAGKAETERGKATGHGEEAKEKPAKSAQELGGEGATIVAAACLNFMSWLFILVKPPPTAQRGGVPSAALPVLFFPPFFGCCSRRQVRHKQVANVEP